MIEKAENVNYRVFAKTFNSKSRDVTLGINYLPMANQ